MFHLPDSKTIIIWILSILLIFLFSWLGYSSFQSQKQQLQTTAFDQGYEQAILQIIEAAPNCKSISLKNQDEIVEIISLDCLK